MTHAESLRPLTPVLAELIPSQRDAVGVTIEGNFRFRELPAPPRGQEVSAEGLREAQRITALTFRADLSESGRMRLELVGAAFPLPPHTENRARADLLGHLLFWPDLTAYRVVPPGALRTLLGEGRIHVTP